MRTARWMHVIGMITTTLVLGSCYYDKEELLYPNSNNPADCTTVPATFAANVQPLIQSKCALSGCHVAASAAGGVILETHAQISARAERIRIRAIVDKTMPPSGPLSPTEAATLQCWIDAGAPNN